MAMIEKNAMDMATPWQILVKKTGNPIAINQEKKMTQLAKSAVENRGMEPS